VLPPKNSLLFKIFSPLVWVTNGKNAIEIAAAIAGLGFQGSN